MNTYFIVRRLVPPYKKHRYMRDGKMYDYLGQILVQMDIDIPEKCRTPQELERTILPFTFPCRGIILNSVLTINILKLDITDPSSHPQKMAELLRPHNIELVWK